jgi:hypothetical protein
MLYFEKMMFVLINFLTYFDETFTHLLRRRCSFFFRVSSQRVFELQMFEVLLQRLQWYWYY